MNERTDLDRLLTAWLSADAPIREPEPLLGQVLARTARTRRRPAWRVPERWLPMSTISTRAQMASRFPLRTAIILALLALAVAAGALLLAGARQRSLPPPFGPARNGHVAWSVNGDIVAADSPTGRPQTILGGSTDDSGPIYSLDGTRLIFVRGAMGGPDAELWVADVDGSNQRRLAATPRIGWAEWSPRGDMIAVSQDGAPNTITIVRADGSGSSVIDAPGVTHVENPIWRPDGRWLTFRGEDTTNTWGIYLMKPDGSGLIRLALDPGFDRDEHYATDRDDYFHNPVWSPDGSMLAFHTLEPDPTSPAGPGFRIHLAEVSDAGVVSHERILEFKREDDDEFSAAWLPQGDAIVFETLDGGEFRLSVAKVAPGSPPARDLGVTATEYMASTISPDGRSIVVSIPTASSVPDVRLIDLETLERTQLDPALDYTAWQRMAP
jgi:Tol biopolymer transport system component